MGDSFIGFLCVLLVIGAMAFLLLCCKTPRPQTDSPQAASSPPLVRPPCLPLKRSPEAQRLVLEKPFGWEFRLIAELLKPEMARLRDAFARLRDTPAPPYVAGADEMQFVEFARAKMGQWVGLVTAFQNVVNNDLRQALGPPGVPGSFSAIEEAVGRIVGVCEELLRWDQAVRTAPVPILLVGVQQAMQGWGEYAFRQWDEAVNRFNADVAKLAPGGQVVLSATISEPPNLAQVRDGLMAILNHKLEAGRAQSQLARRVAGQSVLAGALLGYWIGKRGHKAAPPRSDPWGQDEI